MSTVSIALYDKFMYEMTTCQTLNDLNLRKLPTLFPLRSVYF